jgi:hypothetical protein
MNRVADCIQDMTNSAKLQTAQAVWSAQVLRHPLFFTSALFRMELQKSRQLDKETQE